MPTARLEDRAVLPITGPDAADLLHSTLTLDLATVDRAGIGYGALLTPQGKILSDLLLHRTPAGYAADVRADAAEGFAKRLMLYRLRAKVEIGSISEDLAVFAAWGAAHPEWPADPRVAELGRRWIGPRNGEQPDADLQSWHAHRIALTAPEGGLDYVFGDAFPHDAAMDSLHGVAFDKGCYIGQEVVSRMKHRGTARRRIVAVEADWDLPAPGADIVAGERPLGRLGSSSGRRGVGLVRMDRARAALDAGVPVRVGPEEVRLALPKWATYGWPRAADAGED